MTETKTKTKTETETTTEIKRPPGVPEGARRLTLHELWEECQQTKGVVPRGPRRSLMRFRMNFFPFGISGKLWLVTGGRNAATGTMTYGVHYREGWHSSGGVNRVMIFNTAGADYSSTVVWVWTLAQQHAARAARVQRLRRTQAAAP